MNILQQEDLIKGAPDEVLLQEAQSPSGQVPQYLVVSEIQRRKDMRQRFAAEEEQPQQTVAEQIVAESASPQGIAALLPQTPPQAPVGSVPSSPPMPPPQMPPQMMAAQMAPAAPQPQPEMMADGGIVPNAIIEDASKFNPESLYDVGPMQQRAMANSTDMGIPKTLGGEESEGSLASMFKEIIARAKEGARLGDFGIRDGSITGRASTMLPVRGNPLELGASGYVGSGGAGITGLDLSYEMPKNRFIRGQYQPRDKSWGVQVGGRFNQGGIVKMQQGQVVDPVEPPVDPMAAYAEQQQQRYDQMRKYIEDANAADRERQEQEMMSQALINVGAGIAAGNVASGLEKAGASVAEIRKEQRDREKALELQMIKEMPGGSGAYKDLPSSVREYQYFIGLGPEEQAAYLNLKRQTQKVVDINGVPTIVSLVGNTYFDGNNNPVTPDAGTVVRELPSDEGGVSQTTGIPPTDVSPAVVPEGSVATTPSPSAVQTVPLTTHAEVVAAARREEQSEFTEEQRQERITDAPFSIDTYSAFTTKSNEIDRALEDVMEILDENPGAAGYGSLMRWVPESQARRLARRLSTIQARLAFGELQDMRNASKTGGALGQVSERELDLLRDASIAIDQGASAEDLRGQIDLVIRRYKNFRSDALQRYSEMMLDPVYENEYQIQSRFAGDLNQFKEDLIQGDAIEKRTALEFFGYYQRAGGTVPDDIQAAISNLQSAATTTEEATPEQTQQLQDIDNAILEQQQAQGGGG